MSTTLKSALLAIMFLSCASCALDVEDPENTPSDGEEFAQTEEAVSYSDWLPSTGATFSANTRPIPTISANTTPAVESEECKNCKVMCEAKHDGCPSGCSGRCLYKKANVILKCKMERDMCTINMISDCPTSAICKQDLDDIYADCLDDCLAECDANSVNCDDKCMPECQ